MLFLMAWGAIKNKETIFGWIFIFCVPPRATENKAQQLSSGHQFSPLSLSFTLHFHHTDAHHSKKG